MMRAVYLLIIMLVPAAAGLLAQDPRASIVGSVSDSTGAVIPAAKVTATNTETGVSSTATTNDRGSYEILYLNPGVYELVVEATGFKTWRRSGIQLRTGNRPVLDVALELGNLTETVEVTAAVPLLETTTATMAKVIDSKDFQNLPLRSGSIGSLLASAPGVTLNSDPYDGAWNMSAAGGTNITVGGAGSKVDYNVDGVSNNGYNNMAAFQPPADMIQEARIQTTAYDASEGHSTGGSINLTLKSGTNELRGTAAMKYLEGPMWTRSFFTNKSIFDPNTGPITPAKIAANTPPARWLELSGTVGGPVYLPNVIDGRNKMFWMFGFQRIYQRRGSPRTFSVPTPAVRGGDFSGLLALGSQYQIYDPATTVLLPDGRYQRQPFAGNRIPAERIDPVATAVLKNFPAPNTAGDASGLNNFVAGNTFESADVRKMFQPLVRVDFNWTPKHKSFLRYNQTRFDNNFLNYTDTTDPKVTGQIFSRDSRSAVLDNVFIVSPNLVLNVRFGFTWYNDHRKYHSDGWDITKGFGFPASLTSQLNPAFFTYPNFQIDSYLALGSAAGTNNPAYSTNLPVALNWMRGNHSVKFGVDFRQKFMTLYSPGNVSPQLLYGTAASRPVYTNGPYNTSSYAPTGQGLASFLLGIPTGGGVDINDSKAEESKFFGFYVQDDWRVARRLTLNVGLRWEYETGLTERFNRSTRQFDYTTPSPISAQAQAQYAASPIPQIAPGDFKTLGGLTFAGVGGNPRGVYPSYTGAWMPRFGFAYQVRPNLAVRGGYGIYFDMLGSPVSTAALSGFNRRTTVVASNDNGITYVASTSNPLPSGLTRPLGAAGGLATFVGQSPAFFSPDGRRPYVQRWSFSTQYEPVHNLVIEIGYVGTRGTRLRINQERNPIPRSYLSTSPVRDQNTINLLGGAVANPFRGIGAFAGTSFFAANTTTRAQLLKPYPHYVSLIQSEPAGSSWYHALLLRLERRMQNGFGIGFNYTWSRSMEALAYLNDTDNAPSHVASASDRPHHIAVTVSYELPVSPKNRILNAVAGGWSLQTVTHFESGAPLEFGNIIYTGTYEQMRLPNAKKDPARWFNVDAGFERSSAKALQYNIRTFPLRVAQVRGPALFYVDGSIHKFFQLTEGLRLELRGQADGLTNTPNFNAPNTDPTNAAFGAITGVQGEAGARKIFGGLKLIF